MKNPFEHSLRELGKNESLTEAERIRMRSTLLEYARMKPARSSERRPRIITNTFPLRLSRSLRQRAYVALAAFLTLGLSGTGVAFAAERSLPGDPFYGVKVNVIEPAQTALITSPAAKADWKMRLAERRIDEAARLVEKGALTPQTEDTLAVQIARNVESARTFIEDATSTADARITQSAYASRLAAYDSVLSRISAKNNASSTAILRESLRTQIAIISPQEEMRPEEWPEPEAIHVHVATPRVMSALMAPVATYTESAAAATTTATTTTVTPEDAHSDADLAQIGLAVNAALTDSQTVISESEPELDSSSARDAVEELARAKALTDRAQQLLEKGDKGGAYQAFIAALSMTAQLEVFTRAAAQFKVNAFTATDTHATSTETTASPEIEILPVKGFRKRGG